MIFLIFSITVSSLVLACTSKYKLAMYLFTIAAILLLIVFIPHTIRYINIQL
jgi:hypothetical protein